MFTGSVCTRQVHTCEANTSLVKVAELMRNENVGDLVVVEYRSGDPIPIGIITDRDLVINAIALKLDPAKITVKDIPTKKLITAYEGEQLEVAMERMCWSGIRRVPLVDSAGVLIGIVTLDDIVEKLAMTLAKVSHVSQIQSVEKRSNLT